MRKKPNNLDLLIISVLLASPCFCADMDSDHLWQRKVTPAISYMHVKRTGKAGPLHIHILKVDLNDSKISVRPKLARNTIGGLETTSGIAYREGAVAAVNGSFFEVRKEHHLPIGLMIADGEVINRSMLERATVGITKDKEVIFGTPSSNGHVVNLENRRSVPIWGVNRPSKKDEVIVYTKEYGPTTGSDDLGREIVVDCSGKVVSINSGNSAIPADGFVISLHGWTKALAERTRIGDRMDLVYSMEGKWKDVAYAITGGPFLVRDGVVVHKESIRAERFKKEMLPPTSRTAIGTCASRELILVVVDKRDPISVGVTYDELAVLMRDFGAVNAIGLDGGHASTMYVDGRVVNFPMWGMEAAVSNAVTVTYDGWKMPERPEPPYTYIYVYEPPSEKMIEALRSGARLMPIAYVPRPEDYGLWGLFDIYKRVIKPMVPDMRAGPSAAL